MRLNFSYIILYFIFSGSAGADNLLEVDPSYKFANYLADNLNIQYEHESRIDPDTGERIYNIRQESLRGRIAWRRPKREVLRRDISELDQKMFGGPVKERFTPSLGERLRNLGRINMLLDSDDSELQLNLSRNMHRALNQSGEGQDLVNSLIRKFLIEQGYDASGLITDGSIEKRAQEMLFNKIMHNRDDKIWTGEGEPDNAFKYGEGIQENNIVFIERFREFVQNVEADVRDSVCHPQKLNGRTFGGVRQGEGSFEGQTDPHMEALTYTGLFGQEHTDYLVDYGTQDDFQVSDNRNPEVQCVISCPDGQAPNPELIQRGKEVNQDWLDNNLNSFSMCVENSPLSFGTEELGYSENAFTRFYNENFGCSETLNLQPEINYLEELSDQLEDQVYTGEVDFSLALSPRLSYVVEETEPVVVARSAVSGRFEQPIRVRAEYTEPLEEAVADEIFGRFVEEPEVSFEPDSSTEEEVTQMNLYLGGNVTIGDTVITEGETNINRESLREEIVLFSDLAWQSQRGARVPRSELYLFFHHLDTYFRGNESEQAKSDTIRSLLVHMKNLPRREKAAIRTMAREAWSNLPETQEALKSAYEQIYNGLSNQ